MIEQKDKIYERLSAGLFIFGIGWLLLIITNGPILLTKDIEQIISFILLLLSMIIYYLGKKNDKIPKIETEIEIEYRHKKE